MDNNLYSAIIPVYNSEKIVAETVRQTLKAFEQFDKKCEIVLINDGSKDKSWAAIKALAQKHPEVVAINLLKNYGQHTAVLCGCKYAKGDYLITLDDDLQNPPSEIIHLINKIHEGYDLVFAKFRTKKHKSYRKLGTKVINYLNEKVFNKPEDITLTNFRIFTRDVAQRIISHRTYHPYIPGLLLMYSSAIANVYTEHESRSVGQSNYSAYKIIKLVARLLFNYSSYPLKLLTSIGIIMALIGFMIGLFYMFKAFFVGTVVPGWTTLIVLLSFFNGFTIIMIGILGEYITRMMSQISTQQSYQIKEIAR